MNIENDRSKKINVQLNKNEITVLFIYMPRKAKGYIKY